MYRKRTLIERICALAMAALLVIGVVPSSVYAIGRESTGKVEMGLGELIVKNYDNLTAEEKALLNSGLLTSETITFEPPTTSEGYVTVDSENRTIEVKPYENNGYTWKAVSVVVKYKDGEETVTLTDGKGTFNYTGDNYSVEVTYEMSISVELDKQQALLNGPHYLAEGVKNLDTIASTRAFLALLSDNIGEMYNTFVKGIDIGTGNPVSMADGPAKTAIAELYAQTQANESGMFDLVDLIDEYKAAGANKVQFLLVNGAAMKDCATATYNSLNAIYAEKTTSFNAIMSNLDMLATLGIMDAAEVEQKRKLMNTVLDEIGSNAKELEPAVNGQWAVLEGTYIRSDLNEQAYATLNLLVKEAVGNTSEHTADKAELLVNKKTLEANVNRSDVNVYLYIQRVDGIDSEAVKTEVIALGTLKVNNGVTVDQVTEMVEAENWEATELAKYADVNTTNFDRVVSEGFTGTLNAKADYVITYSPKKLTITSNVSELDGKKVPYGYRLTLPTYTGTDGQAYIYTVTAGAATDTYGQNKVYEVLSNVNIEQKLGAVQEFTLGNLIANSYADMSKEAQAILGAAALNTGASVMFMLPQNGAEAVDGNTVKATAQESAIDGISWIPVKVEFHGKNGEKETVNVVGGLATTSLTGFKRAEVIYELDVTGEVKAEDILKVSNLPHDLVEEAKAQTAAMKVLLDNRNTMASINGELMTALDLVSSKFQTQAAKDAVAVLQNDVYDSTNDRLFLVGYLNLYAPTADADNATKLAYYYGMTDGKANRDLIQEQVDLVESALEAIFDDPGFPAVVDMAASLPGGASVVDKLDQVEKLMETLASINLPAVNDAIDSSASDANLKQVAKFVAAAWAAESTKEYAVAGALKYTSRLSVTGLDSSSLVITVALKNSSGAEEGSISFTFDYTGASYTLKEQDKADIYAKIAELEASLSINTAYYVGSQITIPETITGSASLEKVWQPKAYSYTIGGTEGKLYYDDPVIMLPGTDKTGVELVYTITVGGKSVEQPVRGINSVKYTLTGEMLANINEGIVISVKEIDLAKQKLEQTIADLNKAMYEAGLTYEVGGNKYLLVSFILVENADGSNAVVMRAHPSVTGVTVNSKIADVVQTLISNKYIGLGGFDVYDSGMLHLQGMIDMLLNSGASLQNIANIIDGNGQITESLKNKNWTIVTNDANIENTSMLGGLLIESTLELGIDSKDDVSSYALYITLEDFDRMSAQLSTADRALNSVLNYANVTFANGAVNVIANAPDRAYQAYMTLMMLMNYADIENINEADHYGLMKDLLEQAKDIIEATDGNGQHKFTAAVIQETVNKIVASANVGDNVAKYISAGLRYILKYGQMTENETDGTTYSADLSFQIDNLMDRLVNMAPVAGVDMIADMIAEYETGIHMGFTFKLENAEKTEYAAVIIDNSKTGLNKYRMYTQADLANALATCGNNAIVVLLNDATIPATTIANNIFLDLNGKTLNVDGKLISNGRVVIMDTTLANEESGAVNGTLEGKYVILAGHYTQDISQYLKKGYSLKNGVVVNSLFTVEVNDNDYNVVVNSDFLNTATLPNFQGLAIELLADLAMKIYNNGSLSIGNYGIYSVEYDDFLRLLEEGVSLKGTGNEILDMIDCAGITGFVNEFIDTLTDFGTLADNIEAGKPIAQYEVKTYNWNVLFHYSEDGTYLTAGLAKGDENITNLSFTMDENNRADLVNMLRELDKIVESDIHFELENLEIRGNGLTLDNIMKSIDWSFNADVTIDMTQKPEYPALMAIILASGGAANADELIEGVNLMLNEGYNDMLREALEKVPMNQIVTAMKAVKGQSFSEIIAGLDLQVYTADIRNLEETYHDLLNVVYAALYRLGINGGNATLGSKETAEDSGTYSYTFKRGSLTATATVKLFGEIVPQPSIVVTDASGDILYKGESLVDAFGWTLENNGCTVTINKAVALDGNVSVKNNVTVENAELVTLGEYKVTLADIAADLMADASWTGKVVSGVDGYEVKVDGNRFYLEAIVLPTPDAVLGLPVISEHELLAGWKVDTTAKQIILDVHFNGITAAEFAQFVAFEIENGTYTYSFATTSTKEYNGENLLVNGAELTVTAKNADDKIGDIVTYTIILLGDINADGRTNCADNVMLKEFYVGKAQLTELQEMAADMNQNGRLESGDAVCIDMKFINWDDEDDKYISKLPNAIDDQEDQ